MTDILEFPGQGKLNETQMQEMQRALASVLRETDPEQLPRIECSNEECNCTIFEEKIAFRKLSALVNPLGKEIRIPEPIIVCTQCKTIQDLK